MRSNGWLESYGGRGPVKVSVPTSMLTNRRSAGCGTRRCSINHAVQRRQLRSTVRNVGMPNPTARAIYKVHGEEKKTEKRVIRYHSGSARLCPA